MKPVTHPEQETLARIDQQAMLDQVLAWSAVNTGTRNLAGLEIQAALLAEAFGALPGAITLEMPAPVSAISRDGAEMPIAHGQHLVLRVRPDAAQRVLLTGHMDTVFAADHPFQAVQWREAGMINGPGTADMKGGIAVMLHALMAFEASPFAPRLGYDVLINSDEETGSLSSAPLIAALAKGKLAALTYEPALPDGTLAGERGGSGNFAIIVRGRSAHAGRNPEDGRNALVAAADLALALKNLTSDTLSVNPARIEGGSANNVVPDLAILHVNFRPKTPQAVMDALAALDRLITDVARRHDVHIHHHGGMSRPPKPIDERAQKLFDLVRDCGAALGLPIAWRATGGVCDGNNIAACGVPVIDTMGVRGGAIHSADEFMIVDSLAERARLSALTLMRLAQFGLNDQTKTTTEDRP